MCRSTLADRTFLVALHLPGTLCLRAFISSSEWRLPFLTHSVVVVVVVVGGGGGGGGGGGEAAAAA